MRTANRTQRQKQTAAQDFILMDSHGRAVRLHELLETGPVVVSFYRGGWCPYCKAELLEFQRTLPEIERLGASLVAISPELPCETLATETNNRLTFPILSDVGNTIANRFGIVRKPSADLLELYKSSGHSGDGTPRFPAPSAFVIDPAGSIRVVCVETNFQQHRAPPMVVAALRTLASGSP